MTINEVKTKFELIKKDISDVSDDLFVYWCDQINKYIKNQIILADPEEYITTESYIVTSDYQTSALPTDFKNIQTLGTGLYLVDSTTGEDTDSILIPIRHGQNKQGYIISGSNIIFQNCEDNTYTLRYIPKPTALTALSDDLVVPDEYMDFMIYAVDVYYNQWDEMAGAESLADFRNGRAMEDLLSQIRKDTSIFLMPNFTENY